MTFDTVYLEQGQLNAVSRLIFKKVMIISIRNLKKWKFMLNLTNECIIINK